MAVVYCKTSVCVHKLHLAPLPVGRGIGWAITSFSTRLVRFLQLSTYETKNENSSCYPECPTEIPMYGG